MRSKQAIKKSLFDAGLRLDKLARAVSDKRLRKIVSRAAEQCKDDAVHFISGPYDARRVDALNGALLAVIGVRDEFDPRVRDVVVDACQVALKDAEDILALLPDLQHNPARKAA